MKTSIRANAQPRARKSGTFAGPLACALFASTCLATPALAQDVIPPKAYVTTPGGINIADGSFTYSVTDLSIGPLTLERSHVAGQRKGRNPFFGKNMSHNFDIYAASNVRKDSAGRINGYLPIVHLGTSASGVYAQSIGLSTINRNNLDAAAGDLIWSGANSWTGGNYVYTDKSGAVYTFSRTVPADDVLWHSQRIARIDFPEGRVRTFSYDNSGQLKLVEDSSGYAILFDYNAAGDVSAACGFNRAQTYVSSSSTCAGAALKTSYGYDANGYLTSVVDVNGRTTTYGNLPAGITCVTPPDYTSCKVAMTYSGDRVNTQTLAGGGVWTWAGWDPTTVLNDPDAPAPYDGHNEVTVTDPAGKQMSFTFSKTSPFSMVDANGNTTQFRFTGALYFDYTGAFYHDGTMLIEATLPEGNKYLAEYGGPRLSISKQTLVAKPGSGLADIVETFGYNNCTTTGTPQNCAKPIWKKDARGNQTDFTYASWGGLLTEMQPAPTAGAARPLKVQTYVQKYAYVKNASGALAASGGPIWLPATETVCRTAAGSSNPVCDPSGPPMVTSFEYGPDGTANNLRLRGKVVTADGVSRRTCFAYDNQGNQIAETRPKAGLTTCP